MAEFLTAKGISLNLEKIIENTEKFIMIVSPYVQIEERIKKQLSIKANKGIEITFIFRKDENNNIKDLDWLKSKKINLISINNLHSKAFMNENDCIIGSMNLYQHSEQNNYEMGILINKDNDSNLYKSCQKEIEKYLDIFNEDNKITVTDVIGFFTKKTKEITKNIIEKPNIGYCIRTGEQIQFNPERPLSYEAYKSWAKYEDMNYPEKYCHLTGQKSYGKTCFAKPILKKY